MAMTQGETVKPRRRTLRFSIGLLCVLIAGLAVGMARVAIEASRQRGAIATIKKLGGSYSFDYEFVGGIPGGRILAGAKPPAPVWLRRWVGDEPFREVVRVAFWGDRLRDEDLSLLGDLPRLQEVELIRTPNVTNSGLVHFRGRRSLRSLILMLNKNLGDDGIVHLRHLDELEFLVLHGTSVGDAGIAQLVTLKTLKKINLSRTGITIAGLIKLGTLPRLAEIDATETSVNVSDAVELRKKLPKVQILAGRSCLN